MRDRRKQILKELDRSGFVRVKTLSEMLSCTEMTIRRDLNDMDQEGLLKRTHGGAEKIGANFVTDNIRDLIYTNSYPKIHIAKMACRLLNDGDVIFMDDATSCLYLAKEIKKDSSKRVSIITNSILLALELMQTPHVSLKVIGGDTAGNLSATVGKEALGQIRQYWADKVFIGVNGVDFQEGITGIGYPQMEIKKEMLNRSRQKYVLADHTKFGCVYLSHICKMEELTGILTDRDLKESFKREIREKGYPVQME